MIRNKYTVGLRNQLSEIAMSCDSSAAIDGGGMSEAERRVFKGKLKAVIDWIDKKILPRK